MRDGAGAVHVEQREGGAGGEFGGVVVGAQRVVAADLVHGVLLWLRKVWRVVLRHERRGRKARRSKEQGGETHGSIMRVAL
ncbi:hypothetical protein GCM10022270_08740 [Terriglobus aquaticus]